MSEATQESRRTRSEAVRAALLVDGWLTPKEAGALYDLAYSATGPIVEIGSYQGRSTTALALGAMAGSKQPVYAIDPFIGVPPSSRKTDLGNESGWNTSTPELLRANLDKVGINGQVKIVVKKSPDAAEEIPQCGVLFVDGSHLYEDVSKDLDLYLPKILPGGSVMVHDVVDIDAAVVKAVDERLMNCPDWQVRCRVDSAVIATRTRARLSAYVGVPGSSWSWPVITAMLQASLGEHNAILRNNGNGFDDFNFLWANALNMYEAGKVTHFAMLHSDVAAAPGWLDILLNECTDRDADLVSTAIPVKDNRGVFSCGFGDVANPWGAFRRFTTYELLDMPETFDIHCTQYPDKVLLHNTGCWVADLRKPIFRETDEQGNLKAWFDFPTAIKKDVEGHWIALRESEDWFFSRKLHEMGAKTWITRKVHLAHMGMQGFTNQDPWGTYKNGDEATRLRWEPKKEGK